jgi:mRNA-degrading endonuclease HigB of HigAB toxin-antitoxin module
VVEIFEIKEENIKTSILLWQDLKLDLNKCEFNELWKVYSCKSDLKDMTQYAFMWNSYNSIKHKINPLSSTAHFSEIINNKEAKAFFEKYEKSLWKQELNYDEIIYFELFYNNAILVNKRTYPHWLKRFMFVDKETMKVWMEKTIALYWKNSDKLMNDYATFSNIKYEEKWFLYKISGDRYSNSKKYTKPFYIILEKKDWIITIIEEYSESAPF